jgi:hypothetical protein
MPIYCTKEGIAKRLRGRLNIITDTSVTGLYSQSVPSQTVEDSLVDSIIEQTEEFINLILAQIYELPLLNAHIILTNIVESLVMSELLRIHFQGQGIAQLAGDLSGTGTDTKQYAYGLLQMLTAGHNIYIPGMPPIQGVSGMVQPQPIRLPGELRKLDQQEEDTISRVYCYIQKSDKTILEKENNLF